MASIISESTGTIMISSPQSGHLMHFMFLTEEYPDSFTSAFMLTNRTAITDVRWIKEFIICPYSAKYLFLAFMWVSCDLGLCFCCFFGFVSGFFCVIFAYFFSMKPV